MILFYNVRINYGEDVEHGDKKLNKKDFLLVNNNKLLLLHYHSL